MVNLDLKRVVGFCLIVPPRASRPRSSAILTMARLQRFPPQREYRRLLHTYHQVKTASHSIPSKIGMPQFGKERLRMAREFASLLYSLKQFMSILLWPQIASKLRMSPSILCEVEGSNWYSV